MRSPPRSTAATPKKIPTEKFEVALPLVQLSARDQKSRKRRAGEGIAFRDHNGGHTSIGEESSGNDR
jgi:hypothetical protein